MPHCEDWRSSSLNKEDFQAFKTLMKTKLLLLSLVSVFLFTLSPVACNNLLAAEKESPETQQIAQKYPPDFIDDYMNSCTQLAAEELPQEEAKQLCTCTINQFQAQYTLDEFKKLAPEAKEDVGYSCFEEILYEE